MPRIATSLLWIFLPLVTTVRAGELSHSDRIRASYGVGFNLGTSFRVDQLPLNLEQLFAGIRDGYKGNKPSIARSQFLRSIAEMNDLAEQSRTDWLAEQGEQNLKRGREFMAQNSRRSGVETLPSGLQIEVLKRGDAGGRHPDKLDLVRTHYRGTLIDGSLFEDTTDGDAVWIPVGGVIEGWSQALRQMRVGDKWRIVIPPEIAYGSQGNPPLIGPEAVLIFEVEIFELKRLDIKPINSQAKHR